MVPHRGSNQESSPGCSGKDRAHMRLYACLHYSINLSFSAHSPLHEVLQEIHIVLRGGRVLCGTKGHSTSKQHRHYDSLMSSPELATLNSPTLVLELVFIFARHMHYSHASLAPLLTICLTFCMAPLSLPEFRCSETHGALLCYLCAHDAWCGRSATIQSMQFDKL